MKNFSGVCQAAGADKPLRAFFIWITNIVTLDHTASFKVNEKRISIISHSWFILLLQAGRGYFSR
jgi:hypothetical protein